MKEPTNAGAFTGERCCSSEHSEVTPVSSGEGFAVIPVKPGLSIRRAFGPLAVAVPFPVCWFIICVHI